LAVFVLYSRFLFYVFLSTMLDLLFIISAVIPSVCGAEYCLNFNTLHYIFHFKICCFFYMFLYFIYILILRVTFFTVLARVSLSLPEHKQKYRSYNTPYFLMWILHGHMCSRQCNMGVTMFLQLCSGNN
jgi:hypothetical protein